MCRDLCSQLGKNKIRRYAPAWVACRLVFVVLSVSDQASQTQSAPIISWKGLAMPATRLHCRFIYIRRGSSLQPSRQQAFSIFRSDLWPVSAEGAHMRPAFVYWFPFSFPMASKMASTVCSAVWPAASMIRSAHFSYNGARS